MRKILAFLLGVLLPTVALAQQVPDPVSKTKVRLYDQKNFYVSPAGSDSADCMMSIVSAGHGPCLTIKRALRMAMRRDAMPPGGSTDTPVPTPADHLIINIAPGTYAENVTVNGNAPGLVSPNLYDSQYSSPQILIKGAGSAATEILGVPVIPGVGNYCYTVLAINGAYLALDGLSIRSDTPGGVCGQSNIYVQLATMYVLNDVVLKNATGNHIMLEETANFYVSPGIQAPGKLTIAGNAQYGIVAAANSMFTSDAPIIIKGALTMDILFYADEHSVIKLALPNPPLIFESGATVSGRRFWIGGNSYMNLGYPTGGWPGVIGMVAQGGRLRSPDAIACIGGAPGCVATTPPTGLGTGGSAMIAGLGGGGGYGGAVQLTTGSGATATAGELYLGLPYEMNRGSCAPSLMSGSGSWDAAASVRPNGFTTATGIRYDWFNNGVPLPTGGKTLFIGYTCNTTD